MFVLSSDVTVNFVQFVKFSFVLPSTAGVQVALYEVSALKYSAVVSTPALTFNSIFVTPLSSTVTFVLRMSSARRMFASVNWMLLGISSAPEALTLLSSLTVT